MISPLDIAKGIIETFDKSAVELFRQWFQRHQATEKWIISADFALRDPSRPGDCYAFSIFPYDAWPQDIEADIRANLPRDIKKSKALDTKAAAWLRDDRRFHIILPINTDRTFYLNKPDDSEVKVARESITLTLQSMQSAGAGAATILRQKKLQNAAQAKNFNVALLTDLTLLALFLPIVTLLLARERQPKEVGWFCDRDSMTTWCDGVVWEHALGNLQGLANALQINIGELNPAIAVPDPKSKSRSLWYDDYIRSADWLAGALAAWEWKANKVPGHHLKYRQMIEDVFAGTTNAVVLPVAINALRDVRVTRLIVSLKPWWLRLPMRWVETAWIAVFGFASRLRGRP